MRRALIAEAEPGQILARPVLNINGEILLKPGTDLSPAHIEALRRKGYTSIPIEDPQTRGIEVSDAIPQGVRLQAIKKIAETFDALGTVTKAVQGATLETVSGSRGSSVRSSPPAAAAGHAARSGPINADRSRRERP